MPKYDAEVHHTWLEKKEQGYLTKNDPIPFPSHKMAKKEKKEQGYLTKNDPQSISSSQSGVKN